MHPLTTFTTKLLRHGQTCWKSWLSPIGLLTGANAHPIFAYTLSGLTLYSRSRLPETNQRQLLFYHGGKIILNFAREPLMGIEGVTRADGPPGLSEKQQEALDLVETLAKEHSVALNLQPGDLTFINNHAVVHSREAYKDDDQNPRYLVRMWLKNPILHWKLPSALQEGNAGIYGDSEIEEQWNVAYVPKIQFKISDRLSS